MDAATAMKNKMSVVLYYSHAKREISIEGSDTVTVDEAKALYMEDLVHDCNLSMARLCECDFDMDEVEKQYAEMDK